MWLINQDLTAWLSQKAVTQGLLNERGEIDTFSKRGNVIVSLYRFNNSLPSFIIPSI